MRRAHVGKHQMFGSSTIFARVTVQSRTVSTDRPTERTCGVQAKRAWSNETHRVEDAHNAGMAENGTTLHLLKSLCYLTQGEVFVVRLFVLYLFRRLFLVSFPLWFFAASVIEISG